MCTENFENIIINFDMDWSKKKLTIETFINSNFYFNIPLCFYLLFSLKMSGTFWMLLQNSIKWIFFEVISRFKLSPLKLTPAYSSNESVWKVFDHSSNSNLKEEKWSSIFFSSPGKCLSTICSLAIKIIISNDISLSSKKFLIHSKFIFYIIHLQAGNKN